VLIFGLAEIIPIEPGWVIPERDRDSLQILVVAFMGVGRKLPRVPLLVDSFMFKLIF